MQVNVQMGIYRHADWRHISRAMPGQAHTKSLTENRQLQGWGNAANL
ncbi:Uncharacterised protein [Kluyvera intermedia]|nr:Uncharacterised protein [Kluyvera intermedia]